NPQPAVRGRLLRLLRKAGPDTQKARRSCDRRAFSFGKFSWRPQARGKSAGLMPSVLRSRSFGRRCPSTAAAAALAALSTAKARPKKPWAKELRRVVIGLLAFCFSLRAEDDASGLEG